MATNLIGHRRPPLAGRDSGAEQPCRGRGCISKKDCSC